MRFPLRHRAVSILFGLLPALFLMSGPGFAQTIVAGPFGSQGQYYANSVCAPYFDTSQCVPVILKQGDSLTFTNLDIDVHDVRSDDKRPDQFDVNGNPQPGSAPWCYPAFFLANQCPLFYSDTVGFTEETPVNGVSDLSEGKYQFYCTLHTWMRGQLLVVNTG